MFRFDFHVVPTARGWQLQNAEGESLATVREEDVAVAAALAQAKDHQRSGFDARVVLHRTGERPEVFDFPARDLVSRHIP